MATVSYSEYARSGAIVGDDAEQIDAFLGRCALLQKVLGKGVHPRAIGRLVEIWREVQVEVRYHNSRHDGIDIRVTTVEVWEGEKNDKPESWSDVNHRHILRTARCHAEDQFSRRTGIRIAFDRCLREAVRRAEPERTYPAGRRP